MEEVSKDKKNDVLDISDPNNEDENLILVGGIAEEKVRKFGQNLKSFSEWKREVNIVLKGYKSLTHKFKIPHTSLTHP